jgi:hypothetical protein
MIKGARSRSSNRIILRTNIEPMTAEPVVADVEI